MGMVPNILFSDIDGTFVHYEKDDGSSGFRSLCDNVAESVMDGRRCEIIKLPPASSGSRGAISVKTLKLFAAVRALGVKLVIISGCRSSTLFERMPFLPMADAYVCESGGRIFYPCSTIPSALYLEEDTAWRETHVAAGPPGQEKTQPEKRHGILWEFYDRLMANDPTGTVLDARNYTTAFRVKLAALFEPVPAGLKSASNLGVIDIFPETSGKKNAAFYLMERFLTYDSVFMCDDDNDIELALAVKHAFLPSITSDSMSSQVQQDLQHFTVASQRAMWATEEILIKIISQILEIDSAPN